MNDALKKFNPQTETLEHDISWDFADSSGTPYELKTPWSFATDDAGNLWIMSNATLQIIKLDANGTFIEDFNMIDLSYDYPQALTYGGGYLWVVYKNHITQRSNDGRVINDITIANMNGNVRELTWDDGQLYLSNTVDHQVVVVDAATGEEIMRIGSGGAGSAEGQLNYPVGITIADGGVYIADRNNSRISVFDMDGNFLFTFGDETSTTWASYISLDANSIYVVHGYFGGLSKWNR
jgi:DNA-binding beta-propeller fold protein YncE